MHLTSEHNFYTGFTRDISEGGLFISTYQLMEVGTRFGLSFLLFGHREPINVVCEVRWIRAYNPASDCGPGIGVGFCNLPPESKTKIQRFINQRQTMFFVD